MSHSLSVIQCHMEGNFCFLVFGKALMGTYFCIFCLQWEYVCVLWSGSLFLTPLLDLQYSIRCIGFLLEVTTSIKLKFVIFSLWKKWEESDLNHFANHINILKVIPIYPINMKKYTSKRIIISLNRCAYLHNKKCNAHSPLWSLIHLLMLIPLTFFSIHPNSISLLLYKPNLWNSFREMKQFLNR